MAINFFIKCIIGFLMSYVSLICVPVQSKVSVRVWHQMAPYSEGMTCIGTPWRPWHLSMAWISKWLIITVEISLFAGLLIFKFCSHSRYGSPTRHTSHPPQNHSIIGSSCHTSRDPLSHGHWLIGSLLPCSSGGTNPPFSLASRSISVSLFCCSHIILRKDDIYRRSITANSCFQLIHLRSTDGGVRPTVLHRMIKDNIKLRQSIFFGVCDINRCLKLCIQLLIVLNECLPKQQCFLNLLDCIPLLH